MSRVKGGCSLTGRAPIRSASLALLLAIVGEAIATPPALFAQSAPQGGSQAANLDELSAAVARYYEKPFDIPKFLSAWESSGARGTPGILGFLAGVCAKHPAKIHTRVTARLNRETQAVVIQSLRLAGRVADAKRAAEQWGWPPEQIAPITPVRPLREMKAEAPAHFDTFWGASFATGDAAYVRPIYDYFATIANQPDIDARDIVVVAVATHRRDADAVQAVAKKYPRDTTVRIIYAASALWSLESNGRQHKYAATALDRYTKENAGTAAIKALEQMRSFR